MKRALQHGGDETKRATKRTMLEDAGNSSATTPTKQRLLLGIDSVLDPRHKVVELVENKWVPRVDGKLSHRGMCMLNNDLYLAGKKNLMRWDSKAWMEFAFPRGVNRNDPVRIVAFQGCVYVCMCSAIYCFQPETEQWSEVPFDAIAGTEHFDVAVLGSHLFFIGIDEEDYEGDRECVFCKYDGKDWSSIEYPECDVVNGFALAPFDKSLFIIGGHDYDRIDNPMYMNTVQRYDPMLDRWFDVPGLQKARTHCKAVELNGMLHVFGGEDWSGSLADGECMTPTGWVPSPIKLPERTHEFAMVSVFE